MDILNDYLSSVRKQFEYYKQLGDKTFASLNRKSCFINLTTTVTALRNCAAPAW